ncbi:hypothetical protein PHYSODRAFT_519533, partial [Phytophthora sojae]
MVNDYSTVLIACGLNGRWEDLIEVYETMPGSYRSRLSGVAQAQVIIARAQSDSYDVKVRGFDVLGMDDTKWNTYSCNAVLNALLQTHQYKTLLSLSYKLKQKRKTWNSRTYTIVALAYIRSGSTMKALEFMRANATHMQSNNVECYRELID